MEEFRARKPKVAPSPEARKVDQRPAQPTYVSKGAKPKAANAEWVHAIEDASGMTAEQLKDAIRRAPKKS